MSELKSYCEIKVPIRTSVKWYNKLKSVLDDLPVSWQGKGFHITAVFLEKLSEQDRMHVRNALNSALTNYRCQPVTFDKLDVFPAKNDDVYIINLTTSDEEQPFFDFIDNIRRSIPVKSGIIQSEFRLHVTLGRLAKDAVSESELAERISKVRMPQFSLPLKEIAYREYRRNIIERWELR